MTDLAAAPRRIHLIGICGTGMAGLAGLLKAAGHTVTGSDPEVYPPMSDLVSALGISVAPRFAAENLESAAPDLVVVSNSINVEVRAALDRGLPVLSFPEALATFFLAGRKSIVLTGTHGKTTTTALVAWVLRQAGLDPGFLVGGVPHNFGTGSEAGRPPFFVVEGDEFGSSPWDRRPKFMHYGASLALIHNIEFDHADHYPTLQHLKNAFRDLVQSLPREATLAAAWDSAAVREVAGQAACRVVSYAVHGPAHWRALEVAPAEGGTRFRLMRREQDCGHFFVPLYGEHNVQNALGALVIAAEVGVRVNEMRTALASFKGVYRRQEVIAESDGVTVVDDFAHHPTAVAATLASTRLAFPGRRVWAVFEPHTYTSRTNLLQQETVEALSRADCVIIAEPRHADLMSPHDHLSTEGLCESLVARGIPAWVEPITARIVERLVTGVQRGDVVLLLSPGAFGGLRNLLPQALRQPRNSVGRVATGEGAGVRRAAQAASVEREEVSDSAAQGLPSRVQDGFIHRVFAAQAERTPGRAAVLTETETASFADLNAYANQLARLLVTRGVTPGARVGVMLRRSLDATASLLAVLKAGGAFVPLDPGYPRRRLEFMSRDADIRCLLVQRRSEVPARDGKFPVVALEDERAVLAGLPTSNLDIETRDHDLAFVIYTSGSTGTPNGVLGTHAAMLNRFRWMYDRYPFHGGEVVCQRTPLSFVDSVWETFGPLLAGIPSLIIPSGVEADAERLIALLSARSATRIVLVPSILASLLYACPDLPARIPSLTHWTLSGEAFGRDLAERLRAGRGSVSPPLVILNLYGATEVAADAMCYEVRGDEVGSIIPIGHPISGVAAYVLDGHQEKVADGEEGELYLGGACVSPGYLGRPELNRLRFLPDPFASEPRAHIFRTGDRVRHTGERGFEYLGRVDQQVKIRGVRVELEEVEASLAAHPSVRTAVATLQKPEDGGDRLVVFFESTGQAASERELREFLGARVPLAMVAERIVPVTALPRLPNGKLDRHALSTAHVPRAEAPPAASDGAPPQGGTANDTLEIRLVGILAAALQCDHVSVTDDFFTLGGDSLAALSVVCEIDRELGISLPMGSLIEAPSARALARRLRSGEAKWPSLVPLRAGGLHPPIFFCPGLSGDVTGYQALALALGPGRPSYGLRAPDLDPSNAPSWELEDLAAVCVRAIRTVQPVGPYHVGGHSAAATTAFEVARQLQEGGHKIGLLAVLDNPAPKSSYFRISRLLRPRAMATLLSETLPVYVRDFLAATTDEKLFRVSNWVWWIGKGLRRGLGELGLLGKKTVREVSPGRHREIDRLPVRLRPRILGHREALARYMPSPFDGRVTLFRTRGHWALSSQDAEMGWGELARGGVEVILVPGRHMSMMRSPVVERLGAELEARLSAADRLGNG
ncbi:MAG: amino acid adenylation domain-containing protein [Thermoanaerobaculales bacterium]